MFGSGQVFRSILHIIILRQCFSAMLDFAKIYCKLHPGQNISNFCSHIDCYSPLCPTCLCQHTHSHTLARTLPHYHNIRTTFADIHQKMQGQQDLITQDLYRLNKLFKTMATERQTFQQTLQTAKEDCLKYVGQCFDEIGRHWEKEIQAEQKREMLHDKYKLDRLKTLLNKEMERLIEETRTINTAGFEEQIKRIQQEVIAESFNFHERVKAELQLNETHSSTLLYKKQHLVELKDTLKKILRVEIRMPLRRQAQTAPTTPEKRIARYSCSHFQPTDKDSRVSLTSQKQPCNETSAWKRPSPSDIVRDMNSVATPIKNASTVTVPKILTVSKIQTNSSGRSQLKLSVSNSRLLEKSAVSNGSSRRAYGIGIDVSGYSVGDRVEEGRPQSKKKTGLMLTTPKNQSRLFKENLPK